MKDVELELREAVLQDLSYIQKLLKRNNLPYFDVKEKTNFFYIVIKENQRVGVIGLEDFDKVGLLRSFVVEKKERGKGLGKIIYEKIEEKARKMGVKTLFLLTNTALQFFLSLGYKEIKRNEAPKVIQETTEFDELCPSTAVCMKKNIKI